MNRKTLIVSVIGAAAALALLAWAFAPRPLAVDLARAELGRFETSIDEDARTRLAERFVVTAPLAARVQRSTLREGDTVAAGAVVATLLPVLPPLLDERTLAELRARVGAADAGVQRARTRIEAAKVALEQVRLEWRRTEQLAQQGFVAPTKLDADRLAVQAAQKELDTAGQGEQVSRYELAQARAALGAVLDAGQGAGQRAGQGGAPFVLRSPVAGRVLKVHHPSETTAATGTPLVEIGDIGRLEIVAELLTSEALRATPGSAVRIER